MGSECNPGKLRYDITMSKRTRKPLNLGEEKQNLTTCSSKEEILVNGEDGFLAKAEDDDDVEEEDKDHKSLKQLININGNEEPKLNSSDDSASKGGSRSSLGQHFSEEEKQLQLVRKQNQGGLQGLKLRGMMGRYVKVLSHLIKAKRDPRIVSQKKPPLRLPM